MNHSDTCLKLQEHYKEILKEFLDNFPNYCKICNAQGGFTYYDFVPYGSTNISMPTFEFCENCTSQGLCPRCMNFVGFKNDYYDELNDCSICGWKDGTEGLPEYECHGECIEDFIEIEPNYENMEDL